MRRPDVHRRRYNLLVYFTTIIFLLSILIPLVYFNWDGIVYVTKYSVSKIENFFKKDDKKTTNKSKNYPFIPLGDEEFDDLFYKVYKLEQLSKEYDEENYQLRVLQYIRSGAYNDGEWNLLAGSLDADFVAYVEEKQGNCDISGFIDNSPDESLIFTIPNTNEEVDFYHMFAVMNVVYMGKENPSDLSGWAGDLVQLMSYCKNNNITSVDDIKLLFDHDADSGFGCADVCADFDAVNIINNLKVSNLTSLTECIIEYYREITNNQRITNFRSNTFTKTTQAELEAEIKSRMVNGSYTVTIFGYSVTEYLIVELAKTYNLDFTLDEFVVDACIEVFAEHILPINNPN